MAESELAQAISLRPRKEIAEERSHYPDLRIPLQSRIEVEELDEEGNPTGEFVEDIEERTVIARYPGEGTLMLMVAYGGSGRGALAETMKLIKATFDESDAGYIEDLIRSGEFSLNENMAQLLRLLVDSWKTSRFPTKPSSGSTPSRTSSGRKSTARRPSRG